MGYPGYKSEINENSDHFQDKEMISNGGIKATGREEIPGQCDLTENFSDGIKLEDKDIPVPEDEVREVINNAFRSEEKLMAILIKIADFFKRLYHNEEYQNSEDIVMEAIEDILIGKRKWYKSKCEHITTLIVGVIKSKIRNYANSNKYNISKKIVPLYPPETENENSENSIYDEEKANILIQIMKMNHQIQRNIIIKF